MPIWFIRNWEKKLLGYSVNEYGSCKFLTNFQKMVIPQTTEHFLLNSKAQRTREPTLLPAFISVRQCSPIQLKPYHSAKLIVRFVRQN